MESRVVRGEEKQCTFDTGTLLLTTKRLLFFGLKRTNNTDIHDLINIEAYHDGISMCRKRKRKAETYVFSPLVIDCRTVNGVILSGHILLMVFDFAKFVREDILKSSSAPERKIRADSKLSTKEIDRVVALHALIGLDNENESKSAQTKLREFLVKHGMNWNDLQAIIPVQ